ncbi:hypothetical protein M0802_014180 [Mischocyttarus mexicanus]|nr:hypothetical protein M0802_014180 [Mischocyttarus mexicanus]
MSLPTKAELKDMLKMLWNFYINGTSSDEVTEYLLRRRYYRHPEVCISTTAFWFHMFSTDCYNPSIRPITQVDIDNLCISFLMTMKSRFPSWKINHYMDALKSQKHDIEAYFIIIETCYPPQEVLK